MYNQRGSVFLGLIVVLAILYFFLMSISLRGWGYAGYSRGYAYRSSFWYFGGAHYYGGPSVRSGSLGGPGYAGGGPSAGK